MINSIEYKSCHQLCTCAALAILSNAAIASINTFENGNLASWQYTTTGGSSVTGVTLHNNSQMAYVTHTGTGPLNGSTTTTSSLAHDFAYTPTELFSFDMHAVATTASGNPSGTKHSGSGVKVSFLNVFNVAMGSFSLLNYTNPALLGTNEFYVDNVQHNYNASMGTFASQAGLNPQNAIAKISLTFIAWGQYSGGGNIYPNVGATANVWFDNVAVGAVPESSTYAMLLSGLAIFAMVANFSKRT